MKSTLVVILAALLAGCSGGDNKSGIPQNVADTWPAKWCQAEPGITKEQLVTLMGQPTSASDTSMSWSAHQYQFNAFVDPDGTVGQLDINLHSLSDAEKKALQCEKVRTRQSMSTQAVPSRSMPDACTLVSEAEMSGILGTAVVAEAPGKSKCHYKPASGISPYVENCPGR